MNSKKRHDLTNQFIRNQLLQEELLEAIEQDDVQSILELQKLLLNEYDSSINFLKEDLV